MKAKGISRRKFLALASAGAAAGYLGVNAAVARAMMAGGGMGGMGGMGGGMGGSGSTGVIDPPVGGQFLNLPEAAKVDGAFNLTAAPATVQVNGVQATLLTYNGSFPGPVLRAARGSDPLRINFTNALPSAPFTNILGHPRYVTNLHTHGLHVTPKEPGDCMMVQLKPGDTYNYCYDLSLEAGGHLNFYHPHVHGNVAEQYWGGLVGPLVIADENSLLGSLETHIMVIKDLTLNGSVPTSYSSSSDYMHGKEGSLVMVNGQVNPWLPIRPGQVQRWQIVNACNARFLKLALDRHTLQLIGTDGGLLDKPYPISQILLSPGERIDVLVQANQGGGSFKFLSLPYDRGMNTLQQVTLLTLKYDGTGTSDAVPATINTNATRLKLNLSRLPRRQMTLSMMMSKGYINGQTFMDMEHCYRIDSPLGGYEVWEISNQSGMDHPFHQHVNSCQVLSISGGDSAYAALYSTIPAWKDVVVVPKMGKATLLVPVLDYDGMAMFHCHIIEHEDIGMMGAWCIGM